EKAAKKIAKGYEDEIARLKRSIEDLQKSKPGPVLDNDTGNVVPLHRPLTEDEKAEIDGEADEYAGADFDETATDEQRAHTFLGCAHMLAGLRAKPEAVRALIASAPKEFATEYVSVVEKALHQISAVKEVL